MRFIAALILAVAVCTGTGAQAGLIEKTTATPNINLTILNCNLLKADTGSCVPNFDCQKARALHLAGMPINTTYLIDSNVSNANPNLKLDITKEVFDFQQYLKDLLTMNLK